MSNDDITTITAAADQIESRLSTKTKRCPGCKLTLPIEAFSPAPSRYDGYSAHCRGCARDRARAWRATPEGRDASRKASLDLYHRRQTARLARESASSETPQPIRTTD